MNKITYKQIVSIAIPVMLANLAIPLQSLIDIAIAGHMDESAKLAGLGVATQVITLILVSFNFLQYASSGLSAQAIAHNKLTNQYKQLLLIIQRAIFIACLIGLVIVTLYPIIFPHLVKLITTQNDVLAVSETYLDVRRFSIPAELINYAFFGWFAGQGKTKQLLLIQSFIAVSNIFLTLCLVFLFTMDVQGLALGTCLANWCGVLLSLFLVKRYLNISFSHIFTLSRHQVFNAQMLRLFVLNKDIFIRTSIFTISFLWVTHLFANYGKIALAANTLLLQILTISAFALDGVAVATESLTGQYFAKDDKPTLKMVIKKTVITSYCLASILTLIWLVISPYFVAYMTDITSVYNHALLYVGFAIALPLIGVGAYWIDGVFFGLTAGKKIRQASIIVAMIFFPSSYLLQSHLGITGIWLAIYLFLILRLLVLAIFLVQILTNKVTVLNQH